MAYEEDIQKLEKEIVRLQKIAYHDELTELLNRRGFLEEAGKFFATLPKRREGEEHRRVTALPMSVIFMDIDDFKKINDTHGHTVGDEVLKRVADELPKHFRTYDIICRWGGEEFVSALIGADSITATQIADRIRSAVEQAVVTVEGKPLGVTLSLGVVQYDGEVNLLTLVDKADSAMYHSKEHGKNRVTVYDHATMAVALEVELQEKPW